MARVRIFDKEHIKATCFVGLKLSSVTAMEKISSADELVSWLSGERNAKISKLLQLHIVFAETGWF